MSLLQIWLFLFVFIWRWSSIMALRERQDADFIPDNSFLPDVESYCLLNVKEEMLQPAKIVINFYLAHILYQKKS